MTELKDLGWCNAGGEVCRVICEVRDRCRLRGHAPIDMDMGPAMRGCEHVVSCKECGYVYRYDSSD